MRHVGAGSEPRDPRPLRWADEPGFSAAVTRFGSGRKQCPSSAAWDNVNCNPALIRSGLSCGMPTAWTATMTGSPASRCRRTMDGKAGVLQTDPRQVHVQLREGVRGVVGVGNANAALHLPGLREHAGVDEGVEEGALSGAGGAEQ